MLVFEEQRISSNKKDKQWRINMVDAICSRNYEFRTDWHRMWENYRLKNNQLNQDEYREYCDILGLDQDENKRFVEPFNKTHLVIDVLQGEEAAMPWTFGVVNTSPNATNEILRDKQAEIDRYIQARLMFEIERRTKQAKAQQQLASGEISEEKAQAKQKEADEEWKKNVERLISPADIEKKYSTYKSVKERTLHKLLSSYVVHENVKWLKNKCFEDALVSGLEAVEITVDRHTGRPKLKRLNSLNLVYHKSADSPFIQYGEYASYKEKRTISDVLDEYGDIMSDVDLKRLKNFNGKVFGTNQPFHSPDGESLSHWDNMKRYEWGYDAVFPPFGGGTSSVLSEGLHANGYGYKYETEVAVYTVYWRSQRRVGEMTYMDEYGEEAKTIVAEDFKVPTEAEVETVKPGLLEKAYKLYKWEDADGPKTLRWLWVPEIWKGIRIDNDIYVSIEPYEHAYQSLEDPYKAKLPIHGFAYNNTNAFTVSIMDRMKPWQKLFFTVASRWLKLISQDKGVYHTINTLYIDPSYGIERTLQTAMDAGIIPVNPNANTHGAGLAHSQKPVERVDLSNSQQLTYYTELLGYIESQIKLSAGITEQRLAQTSSGSNVTDNQRDMVQSMNITSGIFGAHNMLWQEILQSLMETMVKSLDSKSGFVRNILSDEEIAIIDLDMISLEDEYVIRISDNSKNYRLLQEAKSLSQALIQNDKVNFSTLLDMMTTESIAEFKHTLRNVEKDLERKEMELAQQQQQAQMEALKKQEEMEQANREHEITLQEMKGKIDLEEARIKAMSWNEDKDMNDDGIPDVFQIDKLEQDKSQFKEKMKREDEKLKQNERKLAQKDKEMNLMAAKNNTDAALKKQALKQKNIK